MKTQKPKHKISKELGDEVQRFLGAGGKVDVIPNGVSGNEDNNNLFKNATQFTPKSERTPLTEVVKTLEDRKQGKQQAQANRRMGPKKRLIVDDFGDPVRWVWDER